MKTIMKTAARIRKGIAELPVGVPFTPAIFLACGTRAAVDQTLSRLVRAGAIERVARGIFVCLETSRYAIKVMPEPFRIAQIIAQRTGAIVQAHGAEAARQLELTTQVPLQPVFCTSGSSRRIHVGKMEVRLQHVCSRKLALAGRPAGLALAALQYLGKYEVTTALIEKVRRKLSPGEFAALKSATGVMPAWMSDALIRHERATHND